MKKILGLVAIIATTAACSNTPTKATAPSVEAQVLSEIAGSVQRASDAQVRLAAMKGSNRGLLVGESSSGEGLDTPISISWSGPIDKLAAKVAELSGFEYGGIIGKRPATESMVAINATNEKGRIILLNANAQSGSAARVEVVEGQKKIVVRYSPTVHSGGFPMMK